MSHLRSPWLTMASIWLASLTLGGCTDAGLYDASRPPVEADRVALRGRVCTEDAEAARFPVRLILLVDQAPGRLYAEFDPGGVRVTALRGLVQSALARPEYALAVVGYAGRAVRLAPEEGAFTRNPGALLNAVDRLALPGPCLGDGGCRDYGDGLRAAGALIEDDLAQTPAGERALTEYVVLFVNAGPHRPLARARDCCPPDDAQCVRDGGGESAACQTQLDVARVEALAETVADAGAAGFQLHAVQLDAPRDEGVQTTLAEGHARMAFAGRGRFARFGSAAAFDPAAVRLFDRRGALRAKRLVVANINARPGPDGVRSDADADGIADADEVTYGTAFDAADTDGDGIGDLVELLAGLDPLATDAPAVCAAFDRPGGDGDLDGLSDCDEALLGTDASLVDSDGDGLPDGLEVFGGTNHLVADDTDDSDRDGVENGAELRDRTDPTSADLPGRLGDAYRYEVVDEGVVRQPVSDPLQFLPGVELVHITTGSTPGIGTLRYVPGEGLSWRDPGDGSPGPVVPVDGPEVELWSGSYAPVQGERGRAIRVRLDPEGLPPTETAEPVRIAFRERQCLAYTVRNIRLLATPPTPLDPEGGRNALRLYFTQAPADRPTAPGPFRLAEVPVRYVPPDGRTPGGAVIEVDDAEFVGPRR